MCFFKGLKKYFSHILLLPGIESVADNNFLKVLLQEAMTAVIQDVLVGAEGALSIHSCHGKELERGHLLHTPSCHPGVKRPRLPLPAES